MRQDNEPGRAGKAAEHLIGFRLNDAMAEGGRDASAPLDEDTLLMVEEEGTLVVSGDIDLHQVAEFRETAMSYIQRTAQPRFDLSRVAFLDSAGLATLLALSRQAKEQEKALRLIVTGGPRRVLKITGIDRMLVIED
jgi:anti-anti-sigma factor